MTIQFAKIAIDDSAVDPLPERGPRTLFERCIEVFAVCTRALAAAWHYEDLSRLCDEELAVRGLRRANLPRVAFDILAEGAQALKCSPLFGKE
jgi:hypothetical protein